MAKSKVNIQPLADRVVVKAAESETKKNLKFVKNKCLEILRCLNDNENYIYGKEEDEALVEKIEQLK